MRPKLQLSVASVNAYASKAKIPRAPRQFFWGDGFQHSQRPERSPLFRSGADAVRQYFTKSAGSGLDSAQ